MVSVFTTIITAISSIIIAYIANNKKQERNHNLLKELTILLNQENIKNKYEVSKIFEFITGLKMNYSDIKELVNRDDSIQVISALKKTPGLVTYKNKKLEYHKNFKPKGIRKAIFYFEKFSLYISFIIMIVSVIFLTFSNNFSIKSLSGIFLFISAFMWMSALKSINYTQELEEIIKSEEGNFN